MKQRIVFLIALAGVFALGAFFLERTSPAELPEGKSIEWVGEELTAQAGSVSLRAIPSVSAETGEITVDISLDTHTFDLGADIAASATMADANGKTVSATAWRGDAPGGHHRSGSLLFPKLGDSSSLTLRLRGIGESGSDGIFQWDQNR